MIEGRMCRYSSCFRVMHTVVATVSSLITFGAALVHPVAFGAENTNRQIAGAVVGKMTVSAALEALNEIVVVMNCDQSLLQDQLSA